MAKKLTSRAVQVKLLELQEAAQSLSNTAYFLCHFGRDCAAPGHETQTAGQRFDKQAAKVARLVAAIQKAEKASCK